MKKRHALGIGLIKPQMAHNSVLPSELTIPWSPLNHIGKGGNKLGYTGNKWIQIYSIDGVLVTSNPYGSSGAYSGGATTLPSPTVAQPFRINRENRLVITGNHTTTLTTHGLTLNASYSIVVREYPSEQDAILRTNWTGLQQNLTVVTTGSWTIPPDSGYDFFGNYWSTPGFTIPDLANAYFVSEFPDGGPSLSSTTRTNRDPRYPSGYATLNETPVLGAGSSCEFTRIANGGMLVCGRTIVFQEGDYNVPYEDGVHAGTVDIGTGNNDTSIIPMMGGSVTGTVGGTANAEYTDGSFVNITMMKPSNTRFGHYTWNIPKARYVSCYFKKYRPTLKRATFATAMSTGGSSGTAIGAIHVTANIDDVKFENCVFDPILHNKNGPDYNAGTTLDGDSSSLCIYATATGIMSRWTIVDCHFAGGTGSIYFVHGTISLTNNHTDIIINRNLFLPHVYQDYIKLTSCYNFTIKENRIIRGPATLSHPDGIQVNFNNTTDTNSYTGGIIKGNVFYSPAGSYGGASIIMTNMGSTANLDGLIIQNNLIWDEPANAIAPGRCTNMIVEFNTVLSAGDSIDPLPSEAPRINNLSVCTASSVKGNIHAYSAAAPTIGGTADSTNTSTYPVTRSAAAPKNFASCLNNPPAQDADVPNWEMATFIDAFKAKSGGTFDGVNKFGWRGADGSYNT